jgi:exopolyphosphatase/guanosine-5'-triphosphate,3'-diphosphate pyrophosphatase
MTPAERMMVANVARYHRGAAPRGSHKGYAALDRGLRRRIKKLAAILRVADGLDRGHAGAVSDIRAHLTRSQLEIVALPTEGAHDLRLEIWGACRKSELLAEVLGVPVNVVAADAISSR